jgi:ATP-binding cassette, subfamily C (CFTR/MRP), member 1
MMMYVLRAMLGGHVAVKRINEYFNAEDAEEGYTVDASTGNAVHVDASFTWETLPKTGSPSSGKENEDETQRSTYSRLVQRLRGRLQANSPSSGAEADGPALPLDAITPVKEDPEPVDVVDVPFMLSNVKLDIPHGAFVAIVGRIGSGKSSLMQGMIGEMRRTRGQVVFGGNVAYVPQTPWIMNATLRWEISVSPTGPYSEGITVRTSFSVSKMTRQSECSPIPQCFLRSYGGL